MGFLAGAGLLISGYWLYLHPDLQRVSQKNGPVAQLDRATAFKLIGAFPGKQKPGKWMVLYRWTL